ncbi:MAG TPA: hypothetical protein VFO94_09195 [Gammaproteobacteria bacterium]|nr:hypothetical protein [Gammaproteobacteria bacterium]
MRMHDAAWRRYAAARKRIRLGQLRARFRFKHRQSFDDFWGEQLLDADIAAIDVALTALADRGGVSNASELGNA